MLALKKYSLIFGTKLGHYNIHYPDFDKGPGLIMEKIQIEAKELNFICSEGRSLRAYQITPKFAKELELDIPVIWVQQ